MSSSTEWVCSGAPVPGSAVLMLSVLLTALLVPRDVPLPVAGPPGHLRRVGMIDDGQDSLLGPRRRAPARVHPYPSAIVPPIPADATNASEAGPLLC